MLKKYISFDLRKVFSQPLMVNVASLGILQLANYIIPIIIIPFVVRALGVEIFGKVSYAQNIITYLTIVVNYGFEYSATQDVAINRDDRNKLSTVFWTTIRFKFCLLLSTFLLLLILFFTFDKVKEDGLLYVYAALVNIGFVLFPTWFFQGMEKMFKMAMFNFIFKALGAVLVILLIQSPSDYRIYLLLLSLSYIVISIFVFFYVIKHYQLLPNSKNKELSTSVIKKGFPIFINNIFVSLYTTAGLTIIGLYLTNTEVGLYAAAYKIVFAVLMLTSMPVNTALFPIMSRRFNDSFVDGWAFFKRSLFIVGVLSLLVCFVFYFSTPLIVKVFLGTEFLSVIPLLQVLSIMPFLVVMASMFTVQGLYGLQLHKYAPFIGALLGVISLIVYFIFIPLYGVYGAAYAWILAQTLEIVFVLLFLVIKKRELLSKERENNEN